jgi:PAS domain S-box-containing protein
MKKDDRNKDNLLEGDKLKRIAKSLIDRSPDPIIVISSDGLIQVFNPSSEKVFGYTQDEVVGKNVTMLMPAPYHDDHSDYVKNYSGDSKVLNADRELLAMKKNGDIFPISLSVSDVSLNGDRLFAGIIHDLTEVKSIKNEFQRIWETVPVGLYQTSIKDGTFLKANPFCAKLLGYDKPEDLVGKKKSASFYPKERRAELVKALKKQDTVTDFEICLLLENNKKVWVCATARLIDGTIEGSLTDITHRKEMELELSQYRQKETEMLNEIQNKINKRLAEFDKVSA